MIQLKKNRSRIRLFSGAFIMLVLALGFNILLTFATLEKLYVNAFISKNNVVAQDLQRNLATAIRFGKSIDHFIGMDKLIQETLHHPATEQRNTGKSATNKNDLLVFITDPDGHILYSSNTQVVGTDLPEPVRLTMIKGKNRTQEDNAIKYKGVYYLSLPVIHFFSKKQVASVTVAFGQEDIKSMLGAIAMKNIALIAAVLFSAMGLLFIYLRSLSLAPNTSKKALGQIKFKIAAVFFIVICLSQITLSLFNLFEFRSHFVDAFTQKSIVMSKLLKQDIEYLLAKGLNIRRLIKMDQKLADIIAVSPELDGITISDDKSKPLYIATRTQHGMCNRTNAKKNQSADCKTMFLKSDPQYTVTRNLFDTQKSKTGALAGKLTIHISKQFLFSKLQSIALDSITVLGVSIFFFVELLILELQLIDRQITQAPRAKRRQVHYTAIRPVAFMFFFGIDTCISFLPLHMATLYNPSHPLLGLSKNIIMGLPISIQMLFTSISLLISGVWCDKRGWAEPFLVGLFLSGSGFIFAWLAPSSLFFLIALGLVGMGYGLSLMAAQGFVIAHTTARNSAQGMAQLWAGVYAGSICGGATGAMLADRIGYAPVFLVGGTIVLMMIVYTFFIMKDAVKNPKPQVKTPRPTLAGQTRPSSRPPSIFSFLFTRKIFTLILFYGLPWYIVLIGFMNYYSPIYLKDIGVSQSNIGRIFMIYGICLMYISPHLSRLVGRARDKKQYLVMGSFIGSLSIANFYFFKDVSGVVSVTVSIFLLGLSACLIPVRSAYVLDFQITQQLGGGKAIGVLNAVLRLGQVTGPILFGWLFITLGSDSGIALTAATYLIFTLIFIFLG